MANDTTPDPSPRKNPFAKALFDIEHALSMYAVSFSTMPAEGIYEKEALEPLMDVIDSCHIYLIGYTPRIDLVDISAKDGILNIRFTVLGKQFVVKSVIPTGFSLKRDGDLYFLENGAGQRLVPNTNAMQAKLNHESNAVQFDVKYIGQAYGRDGSRNAIDRLLKHETLQKIALKGVPDGCRLTLLLLEIQPSIQLITAINPFAEKRDDDGKRRKAGLDKLFNTTEQERIALYEAALIRYFYPEFNKEFKDSFPSTDLKILQDCYAKDFSAVFAEICIDELPFTLRSEKVAPAMYHVAKHDLHKEEDRQAFFGF